MSAASLHQCRFMDVSSFETTCVVTRISANQRDYCQAEPVVIE
jgi:hypothetical protein